LDVSNGNPPTSDSNQWLKLLGRHPIGATGAVLTTKLIHSMRQDGLTRGLVALCIGGGQGIALAIEVLH
jgi:acetyl-CoA acetyltransferase